MQGNLVKVAILFAIVKFVPNQYAKGMALGVAGVFAANYVPYLNGKDLKGAAV